MNTTIRNEMITTICSSLLILLFIYAAASKLLNISLFNWQLSRVDIFSKIAPVIAYGTIAIELILSLFLATRRFVLAGLYGSLLLLILFTLYIFYMLQVNEQTPCSCGGALQMLSWHQHIWFNGLMIGIACIGIYLHRKKIND